MTRTINTEKIPNPIYAAAGAGDLAYQKLRTIPARVAELREKVSSTEFDLKADVEKLRVSARRNANAFVIGAQAAQDRAASIYTDLVARGQQVMRPDRDDAGTETAITAEPAAKPTPQPAADASVHTAAHTTEPTAAHKTRKRASDAK